MIRTSCLLRCSMTGFVVLAPVEALAHIGHIGEVAGHAHWIGLAAAAGAAVIGAWIASQGGEKAKGEDNADAGEGEAEGETA